MRSSKVCDIGMMGPPHSPWPMRHATSMVSDMDRPHSTEKMPKPIIAQMNIFTTPNRWASQPVKGTQMASATA